MNFIGRHIIESLLDTDAVPRGSAIAMISSVAGMGWQNNLEYVGEFLDTPDWDTAVQ